MSPVAHLRGGGRPGRLTEDAGFGLIEVLVSALIVALIAAAVATALVASADTSADQRARSAAAALAQQDQERLRGLSAQQLTDLEPSPGSSCGQTRTVTEGGIPYTICSSATFLNSTGGSACGSTGAGAAAYYEVSSSINWPNNRRTPVVMTSQITPPAGGTLLTQTVDQTGAPLAGVAITATGAGSAAGTTDGAGCVIFAGLPTGDYTLAINAPGYVNDADQPANPLDISATVTSSGTATPSGGNPIRLGLAGRFNATFWAASAPNQTPSSSGAYANQPADSVSWYGTGSSDSMPGYLCILAAGATCPASSSSTQATAATIPVSGTQTLYPFAYTTPSVNYSGNYHIWAGPCRQQEPPAGIDSFTIAPGSTQTLAIQEPAMNLAVDFNNGRTTTPVVPQDLMLKFTSTSGTSCSDKWSTPVNPNAGSPGVNALLDPGQPFASTATSGSSASASTQTGTISVCADYTSSRNQYYGVLSGLQNTSFSGPPTQQVITLSTSSATGSCSAHF